MREEVLYRWALTRLPGIGPATTKQLFAHFGNAAAIFQADKKTLADQGLHRNIIHSILTYNGLSELRHKAVQMKNSGIRILFFTDKEYPARLNAFKDSPPLLFYKGRADLNAAHIISVIGTRSPTIYGRDMTARLIGQLAHPGLVIVSGMAMGIDGFAHKAALDNQLPTIGVLGHGHYSMYPSEHAGLANHALQAGGGLLSPFEPEITAAKYRFPERNPLIAGCCDALLVIETRTLGGSLYTVSKAIEYGKKVFAIPGRITDPKSSGCNHLIRQREARLVCSGEELLADMGWQWASDATATQPSFSFGDQPEPKSKLLKLLTGKDSMTLDELSIHSKLGIGELSIQLLQLEMEGTVHSLPGKRFCLRMDK